MKKPRKPLPPADKLMRSRDGYQNFVSRVGVGTDNQVSAGSYTLSNLVTRNRIVLEAAYRGAWIVGAVVDNYADDMTREGITINLKDPQQARDLGADLQTLNIWNDLNQTIKWARLYGGAIAVMVIDGQDTATPLRTETVRKGQFKGLRVYDRWQLQPDLTNLVAGMPMYYTVVSQTGVNDTMAARKIHYSRCVRMDGIRLPWAQAITEELWSESVIERLYDRLINFDNASNSAAQLINRASLRVVSIEGLRQILSVGGPGETNLLEMFALMRQLQTNEGITLLDSKDTFQSSSYTFAGLADIILQLGQQIAGATGIPLVRLFGQSPAGLNSTGESDIRQYYDNVKAKQESDLRIPLLSVLKVMYQSRYGTAAPDDMVFEFTPLWQQSPKEKAENAKIIGEIIDMLFNSGLLNKRASLQELRAAQAETGLFGSITDADISDAEEEDNAPPEPMAEGAALTDNTTVKAALKTKDSIASTVLGWIRR